MFSGILIGIARDRLMVENFVKHLLSSGTRTPSFFINIDIF